MNIQPTSMGVHQWDFFWCNPNISCGGGTPSNSSAPHYRDTAPNRYFQTTGYSTYPHVIKRGTWKSSRNMGFSGFFFILKSEFTTVRHGWYLTSSECASYSIAFNIPWRYLTGIHATVLSRSLFCDIPDSYPIFLQFLSRFDPIIILNIVPT